MLWRLVYFFGFDFAARRAGENAKLWHCPELWDRPNDFHFLLAARARNGLAIVYAAVVHARKVRVTTNCHNSGIVLKGQRKRAEPEIAWTSIQPARGRAGRRSRAATAEAAARRRRDRIGWLFCCSA